VAQDRFQWRALVNTIIESLCSLKGEVFLYQLSDYQLLKSTPASLM